MADEIMCNKYDLSKELIVRLRNSEETDLDFFEKIPEGQVCIK